MVTKKTRMCEVVTRAAIFSWLSGDQKFYVCLSDKVYDVINKPWFVTCIRNCHMHL